MPFDLVALLIVGWCWFVNISLNLFGYLGVRYPRLAMVDKPLDGGALFFDGFRILGASTTWGGLLLVLVIGALGTILTNALPLMTLAFLVYVGHLLGSGIKRRLGISDGGYLPGIDHADYLLVAGMYALAIGIMSYADFLIALALTVTVTPLITSVAFGLRLRTRPL